MILAFVVAHAQSITGGFGPGVFAGREALERPGVHASASVEAAQLAEEVPWLGVGAELVLGVQPKYCTRCTPTGAARLGIGPLFRQKAGFVMVGARYSVFGARRGVRPFALTRGRLPVARGEIRPYLWVEGLTGTELGAGVEVGFAVREGRLVFFPKKATEDQNGASGAPTANPTEP